MKHYSAAQLGRSAALWRPGRFHEECDVLEHLRSLVITEGKRRLARQLGVSEFRLTGILRGRWPLPDETAQKLGYRKIVRYERIS